MVLLYILLHILFAPVDERVYLNQVMNVVPFHYLHILAGYALLLSQSADSYVESLHRPLQRFQLSNLAAAVSAFYRIIEEVDAFDSVRPVQVMSPMVRQRTSFFTTSSVGLRLMQGRAASHCPSRLNTSLS